MRLVDTTETTSGAAKIGGRDTRDSHRTGRDPGARVMTTCDMDDISTLSAVYLAIYTISLPRER